MLRRTGKAMGAANLLDALVVGWAAKLLGDAAASALVERLARALRGE